MNNISKVLLALPPIAAGMLLSTSKPVAAHAYISAPESRGYLCRLNENTRCGNIVYEPQSLEGTDRFPETGPADGRIASAGHGAFAQLDAQNINRWTKRHIKAGPNEFTWTFTAAHSSRDWRYFITKSDWNPNSPLTRDQFESVPFCEYQGENKRPPRQLTHLCNVPADRSGYHIVLGVWDVADTPMSFYNTVDLMIDNGDTSDVEWQDVGDIFSGRELNVGDKVKTRVFGTDGELSSLQTILAINSAEEGKNENWTFKLAQLINQSQSWIQAGQLDKDNQVNAVVGKNEIYVQSNSGIISVELEIDQAPPPKPDFYVAGIGHHYQITDGKVIFDFDVEISQAASITATLNKNYKSLVTNTFDIEAGASNSSLIFENATAGHYNLVVSFLAENKTVGDQIFHLNIVAEDGIDTPTEPDPLPDHNADFTFPEQLSRYKAGTLVMQPKTGKVYECKPWPYNGYCVQWSESTNQFEPGVGSAWTMAWVER
jgi:chitin-binding protein